MSTPQSPADNTPDAQFEAALREKLNSQREATGMTEGEALWLGYWARMYGQREASDSAKKHYAKLYDEARAEIERLRASMQTRTDKDVIIEKLRAELAEAKRDARRAEGMSHYNCPKCKPGICMCFHEAPPTPTRRDIMGEDPESLGWKEPAPTACPTCGYDLAKGRDHLCIPDDETEAVQTLGPHKVLPPEAFDRLVDELKPEAAPRFFIDHDVIHDRVTGRHVFGEDRPDPKGEALELLNELSAAFERVTAKCERYRHIAYEEAAHSNRLKAALARAKTFIAVDVKHGHVTKQYAANVLAEIEKLERGE